MNLPDPILNADLEKHFPDPELLPRQRALLADLQERIARFNQVVENLRSWLKDKMAAIEREMSQLEQTIDRGQIYDKEGRLNSVKNQNNIQERKTQVPIYKSIQAYQQRAAEALDNYSESEGELSKSR